MVRPLHLRIVLPCGRNSKDTGIGQLAPLSVQVLCLEQEMEIEDPSMLLFFEYLCDVQGRGTWSTFSVAAWSAQRVSCLHLQAAWHTVGMGILRVQLTCCCGSMAQRPPRPNAAWP